MRENRTQGSVRGQSGNWLFYLDAVIKMKTPTQFLQEHKFELIEKLEEYLRDTSSHEKIQKYVWDIIEAGGELSSSEPYEKGEDVFLGLHMGYSASSGRGSYKVGINQNGAEQFINFVKEWWFVARRLGWETPLK